MQIAQAKAKGSDTSDLESSLADEQKKLSTNIATDKSNAGKASKGVVAASSANDAVETSNNAASSSKSSSAAVPSKSAAATVTASSSSAASTAVTQTAANFKELEYVYSV